MKRAKIETPGADEECEGPQLNNTDYSRCVICQKVKTQKLYNVTQSGLSRLMTAAEARQDESAIRLEHDIGLDTFLQEKALLWRAECRNVYALKKSYELAKKRCIGEDSTSACTSECTTRSSVPKVNLKSQCVICNKVYDRHGKQPKSLVATDTRQRTLLRKAKALNDQALLHRIQGYSNEAIDMVAYDVCYHIPCMNRYLAQRDKHSSTVDTNVPSDDHMEQVQPSDTSSPCDIAFRCLIENIHKPLFNDLVGYFLVTLRDMHREELRKAGMEVWDTYKSRYLKNRLQNHYGEMIAFMPLMNLLNKVNLSISYGTFHRELSGLFTNIHRDVMRNGLYLPPNMKHHIFTQFAIDNIDWDEKTTDGATYHATSKIMVQPPSDDNTNPGITFLDHERTTRSREKSISEIPVTVIEPCHLSSSDRKKSRSL